MTKTKKATPAVRTAVTVIVTMGETYRDAMTKALAEMGATDLWGQYEEGSTLWKVKCLLSPTVAVQTELRRQFPGTHVKVVALTHFLCIGPNCWGRGTSEEAATRKARTNNPGYTKFKVLALYECTEDCGMNGMGYVVGTAAEKIR